jgi:hypothetical protein
VRPIPKGWIFTIALWTNFWPMASNHTRRCIIGIYRNCFRPRWRLAIQHTPANVIQHDRDSAPRSSDFVVEHEISRARAAFRRGRNFPDHAVKFPDVRNNFRSLLTSLVREGPAGWRLLVWKHSPALQDRKNSLQNSLFAGNLLGDRCDQHCVASQAVTQRWRLWIRKWEKCPPIAAFCEFVVRSLYSKCEQLGSDRPTFEIFPFWRRAPETGRDQHCVVDVAVSFL